jgi:NAD(P)H-dependent FMN reductase/ribosomal protein S18 acetylase RimI-like enzyme
MQRRQPVRVLGISGSLRQTSSNSALLYAARQVAPAEVQFSIFEGLGGLPPFNPDLGDGNVPTSVANYRHLLQDCHAVFVSSPEYAHGVPGVLKNALDWVVSSGELIDKPIALVNASSRATHAWRSLAETLTTMSARIVLDASVTIPLDGRSLNAEQIGNDSVLSSALRDAIGSLTTAAGHKRTVPMDEATLRTVQAGEDRIAYVPLLRLADGSAQQVHSYLHKGTLYTFSLAGSAGTAGVILATHESDGSVELKTVAVAEVMQGRGIGTRMLRAVLDDLRRAGVARVVVGTASSGIRELGFYQKAGFRPWRIERDFFSVAKGYPANSTENGILVRDMVWMDQDLT